MKNLKNLTLILLLTSVSVFNSCKKTSSDDLPTVSGLDHQIQFKITTNEDSAIGPSTYTDGAGGTKAFTIPAGVIAWSSNVFVLPSTVKTISFSSFTYSEVGRSAPYLIVQIWVDGVKKTESTSGTLLHGQLKATATYTF